MSVEFRDLNAIYQIYPRSFQDTNGDGIGDIQGIISQLDYIKTLSDAIWLSPIYQSPQKDFGYDVSSYTAIAPEYGTLEQFDHLIAEAHTRGVKVMMDFVPNHTSDQHEWFKQSRSSRDNPRRDWYVWRDPKNGAEPNNWVSLAGGKSWEYDNATGQYYLHSWMSSQPDLNWENPDVRQAMNDTLRFWLERGVDGFRMDAVWVMAKDPEYRDEPVRSGGDVNNYSGYEHVMCRNGARLDEYIGGMSRTVGEYGGVLLLEYYSTPEFGQSFDQLYSLQSINTNTAVFFFDPLHWDFSASAMGDGIATYLASLPSGAAPVFCFGNHDQSRIATRFDGQNQARLIATLQLTMPGVPCIYNGEELGMINGYIPAGEGKDGFGSDGMMAGRDPQRTPLQWSGAEYAGFTTVKPWLPVDESYKDINVRIEQQDNTSVLALYRHLLGLRRSEQALRVGKFALLGYDNNVLAYDINHPTGNFSVLINFNSWEHNVNVGGGHVIGSSLKVQGNTGVHGQLTLSPYEAIIIRKDKS